jgi:methylated-DNA-[protein]-cysteine S-methyltransferase
MELYNTVVLTSWGYMAAQFSKDGLWALGFPRPTQEEALAEMTLAAGTLAENAFGKALTRQLCLYFTGRHVDFSIPIDWSGYTAFQIKVLQAASRLLYGTVSTYGAIARDIGSPQAARAVGNALNANRTPIIVPCHRVVGANGSLTGFGGGLPLKKALLDFEAQHKFIARS